MNILSNLNRLLTFPKIGIVAALLGVSIFWACHLDPNDTHDAFKVTGDTAWTKCDSVTVVLLDETGKEVATLFNGPLTSLDQLNNLPADEYLGGKAKVRIFGRKNGASCFDEIRTFDDKGSKVVVDTLSAPDAKVLFVEVLPTTLLLTVEDSAVEVQAAIKPAYAEQSFIWSITDDKIAALQFPGGVNSGKIKIKSLKAGSVKARARSKNDTSKYADVTIKVEVGTLASVTVTADSLKLYVGGPGDSLKAKVLPEGTDQGVEWTSDDVKVAQVDAQGRVTPKGEGSAHIQAKSKVLGISGSAVVFVKRDLPVLTVASRSGAAINVSIDFSAKAVQEFGNIIMFKMDFEGDGTWDDSLNGPWSGNSVDLPIVSSKYAKEGNFVAKFLVRDGEGNEAVALVSLEIGNQAPEILNISKDTTLSIKDSVKLFAKVRDFEGKVAWSGWDFEGDGKFDDSVTTADSVVDIVFGRRYLTLGSFNAILKVKDDAGKARLDTVKVNVILDPPVADAGNDTTVMAGTFAQIHAKGTDKYGVITKREIKIGSDAFLVLSKPDTAIRPPVESGKFNVVVRVTDDDGNSAMDTMVVTVSTPSLSNADLANMIPSLGTLTPTFKPITLFYSVVVAFADSQLSVKATPSDTGAKLAINGKPTAAGVASDPVSILVGTTVNVFQIVVTAQDGTQKVYTLSVTRAPSAEAQLSKLEGTGFTLKPVFASATLDYADTVANAVASVTVKATVSSAGAKVAINDSTLPSGNPSNPVPLKVGDNPIRVTVTAQDGKTKATYTVNVVRRAKLIVYRRLGVLALPVQTDSLEAPLGSIVNISVPDSLGFGFSSWNMPQGNGVFQDSLAKSTKVSIQSPVVRVTARFEITTYTITSIVGPGGILAPSSGIVDHGKDFAMTATPLVGYRILTFTDNGKDVLDPTKKSGFTYTLKSIVEPHLVSVTFLRIYSLTAISTNPASGTIAPSPNVIVVDSGASQTFTLKTVIVGQYAAILTDNKLDVVGSLQGDPSATSTYALTDIKANHEISATFATKSYSISTKGEDKLRGTVTPETNPVKHGDKAVVIIEPAKGYRVLTVTDNDKDVTEIAQKQGFKYLIDAVTENHVVIATFMRIYTLTGITNNATKGTISPTSTTVDSMASAEFTLTAAYGQYVSALTDNGDVLPRLGNNLPGAKSTYTLKEISEDHPVSATFAQKTYSMIVTGHDLCIRVVQPPCPIGQICFGTFCLIGSGPDADTITVPYGESYNISTDDSLGTRPFLSWTKDGASFATTTYITTGPITSDVTFTANYKLIIRCCPGFCCPIDPGPIIIKDPILMSPATSTPLSQELILLRPPE